MGLAIAETFAAEGARVAVMARGQAHSMPPWRRCGPPELPTPSGSASTWPTQRPSPTASPPCRERWGALNSLVHTIGPATATSRRWTTRDWDAAFALGTSGRALDRAALPMLRAADWARIVNLSAHSIQRQNPRIVAYTASKAALCQRHEEPGEEPRQDGILVNASAPARSSRPASPRTSSYILAADGLDSTDPVDVMTWIENNFHQPGDLGRAGLPEEIATITAYLASRRNGYVTGRTSTSTAARTSSEQVTLPDLSAPHALAPGAHRR